MPLAQCLQRLKYRRERHVGRALGRLLADELESPTYAIDALVAVPLHRKRLRARTFNQADEICRVVAKQRGIPMLAAGIRRTLDTAPQTALDRAGRLRGPDRAFRVDLALIGRSIAIIDDVITTGATVNALGRALKAAGATRVEAWSVARSVRL